MKPQNKAFHFDARNPRNLMLALLLGAALAAPADAGSTKFIPTFLVYYGGGPTLTATDAPKLAKFDLIDIDRFRHNQIGANTWQSIKALNPGVQIYLYQMGPESTNYMDASQAVSLNNLGRYDVSRGHSMGALNGNNPALFQLNASGQRIYNVAYSNVSQNRYWHLMDFGSPAYQQYWVESSKADVFDQPWAADGLFVDNCLTTSAAGGYSSASANYPSNAAWSAAMNAFTKGITAGVHAHGQKLWCNKGDTTSADGAAAWLDLDNSASPPDVLLEEGAFAVKWGNGVTQFFPEANWKRQVDTMGAMRNTSVAMLAHTKLFDGQSGTDNWGQPVTFGQTLWYALGSFLLGKNDALGNAYFTFVDGNDYNRIPWFEEYDRIDLGRALGAYQVASIGGVNLYWREFERGYVYVNPTASNIASIPLAQPGRVLVRDTLASLFDLLPIVTTLPLKGHHAAFVLKTTETPAADTQAPTVPTGLAATAVSGTQVNLAWNASTDNVGVTGYYVYLNDQPLATTTATSFSHSGLTAGTTYNYRVSAYDAVPNHSAWTAAVAAIPAVADTQAPTVPAGLTATAVSGTQVNLAWSASTDNVGVTGYYVYLNDAPLAAISATSFSHTGLTAGNTYRYRVSAFDAVPNHSAWTAVVSATTGAPADTQAPSVPAGLTATAVSGTQVNLAWNASTDNVGVAGYTVYLNDAPLATTTATAFSHTGLTAGSTYRYRVSAFDAVPNHSAWTAVVSARTAKVRADFDGDGKSEILWRNAGTGQNYLYPMDGTTILATEGYLRTVVDPNWTIAGIGDFDGDGKADVLWRNSSTGENYVYLMNGTVTSAEGYLRSVTDQAWQVAGIGDFDGDGKDDILWRNAVTGQNYVYPMNGLTILATEGYLRTMADLNWGIVGVGDLDGDGKADVLWRNSATGENYLYPMDGLAIKPTEGYLRMVADPNWGVAGIGDYNGDGKADILWRNGATGENYLYPMNGTTILGTEGYLRTVADLSWQVKGTGDYDGDGKADVLWRHAVTGENYLYPMDGITIKPTEGYVRTAPQPDWRIQNPTR